MVNGTFPRLSFEFLVGLQGMVKTTTSSSATTNYRLKRKRAVRCGRAPRPRLWREPRLNSSEHVVSTHGGGVSVLGDAAFDNGFPRSNLCHHSRVGTSNARMQPSGWGSLRRGEPLKSSPKPKTVCYSPWKRPEMTKFTSFDDLQITVYRGSRAVEIVPKPKNRVL